LIGCKDLNKQPKANHLNSTQLNSTPLHQQQQQQIINQTTNHTTTPGATATARITN
jgi:hypothetical protein